MSVTFVVHDAARALGASQTAWLGEHLRKVGELLNLRGEVRVRVVDDTEMAAVHLEYLDTEGTTDVITFDLTNPDEARPEKPTPGTLCTADDRVVYGIDSDIWVCADEGRRQAAVGGYPLERELFLYIVHGVLHCLGWDDHDEGDAAAMHAMEDAVLQAVGAGSVHRQS